MGMMWAPLKDYSYHCVTVVDIGYNDDNSDCNDDFNHNHNHDNEDDDDRNHNQ